MIYYRNELVRIKRINEGLIDPFIHIIKDTKEFIFTGSFSFWLPYDDV